MKKGNFFILLIEDNPGDIRLIKEVFKECDIFINLNVVKDGVEALDYLYQKDKYKNSTRPDMIFLDLNLPKKDGREVLFEIKNNPDLNTIPVAILTTSKAEEDILNTYNLYANCYLIKPINIDHFIEMIKSVLYFWFSSARLK